MASLFSQMLIICSDDTTPSSRTSLLQYQQTFRWVRAGKKLPQGSGASRRRIPTPVSWHDMYLPSLTALKLCRLAITQYKFMLLRHTLIFYSQVFVNTRAVLNPWRLKNVVSSGDLAVFFIIAQIPYDRCGCRIALTVSDRVSILWGADFSWQAAPESFLYSDTWARREAF